MGDPIEDAEFSNIVNKVLGQVPEYLKLMPIKAKLSREYYNCLIKEGFKDKEAIDLVSKTRNITEL